MVVKDAWCGESESEVKGSFWILSARHLQLEGQ